MGRETHISLCVVWLCLFCDYVLMTMAIPIFPLLHASDFMTGVLFAAKATCQILSTPLFMNFIDGHEKAMIVFGLGLEIGSLATFTLTFSYSAWMLARGISGVASAAIISAGFAHLKNTITDDKERGTSMGLATTGIIAGVCLGPVWGGTLFEIHPSIPFVLLAVVEVCVLAFTLSLLPGRQSGHVRGPSSDDISVRSMLVCPQLSKVLGALLLANAAISCLESTVARYFMDTFGFSVSKVSLFYLLTSVPSCVMSAQAGPAGNRFGRELIMFFGLCFQGFFTLLGPKDVLYVEMLCFFFLGGGMGAIDGTAPALLGAIADARFGGTGKVYLMQNMAVQVGFVLGPVLGNAVVEARGFACGMFAMGLVLLLYALLFLPRRRGQAVQDPLLGLGCAEHL
eukprot:TRINITY_DN33548_c0_g1_i1.p1 TRINITY_DN33548_c0_g1~~TRINITY_DN33548_c0_g1_i1.p1  ORF type:complete len:416 (-),score=25.77 TRINITY_DN33548_c0_g1_i1:75-1268(-)